MSDAATPIVVLLPSGTALVSVPAGAEVASYGSLEDALAALSAHPDSALVILSDGLSEEDGAQLAARLRGRPAPVFEVRSQRLDGTSASALGGACTGVIAGFGAAGVTAAVEHIRRLATT